MSCSKVLAAIAALSLAGGSAGCFQPLYSESAHPGLVEDLRAIEVAPIPNRIGHYLADDLATDLNGTGQSPPPKYRLTVTVTLGTGTPTVNSELNVATSATLTGEANYTLIKVDGGAQVLKSNATRRRGVRPHPGPLCRPARPARRGDSHRPRAFAGNLSAPRFGAGRENLVRPCQRPRLTP